MNASVRRCANVDISGCKRGRGKSKKNWNEMIRQDRRLLRLMEDMTQIGVRKQYCGYLVY